MARAAKKKKPALQMIEFSRARDIPFNRIHLSADNVREIDVDAGLDDLTGVVITHLHADHVSDYYNYALHASTTGRKNGDVIASHIPVYGPGSAGGLPDAFEGRKVGTVAPAQPAPGTKVMTDRLHEAFAYTTNLFMRDAGFRDPRDLLDVTEIALPNVGATFTNRSPRMRPFVVMEDSRVRVTATLVPHGPVFPAFAFRFDTDHGSVTFSGDTAHSENLIELARGSDVLVHEALRIPPEAGLTSAIIDHHLKSHVLVEDTGPIATKADVPWLVLSHIEDTAGEIDYAQWKRLAQRGYDGRVTIARDLDKLAITRHRR